MNDGFCDEGPGGVCPNGTDVADCASASASSAAPSDSCGCLSGFGWHVSDVQVDTTVVDYVQGNATSGIAGLFSCEAEELAWEELAYQIRSKLDSWGWLV